MRDAVRFVGDLRDKISDNLETFGVKTPYTVQQKIYEAIGPGGLNWLRDASNQQWRDDASFDLSAINVNDVLITENSSQDVRYQVRLKQSLARVTIPVDFDLGLPFLGLEVDGSVQLDVGFEWELGFGLDKNHGFYLTTGISDEIRIFAKASTPGLAAQGRLGFLQLDVTDGADLNGTNGIQSDEKTSFTANLNVDLRDPGTGAQNDGKLFLSELSRASFPQVVAAYFPNTVGQNEAKIQLHLVGSVGGDLNFPQIETDFTVGWKFGGSSATVNSTSFGSAPEVWFKNVEIDPGQAIQSFAKPILERVNAVLAPVRPVIEVLQTPLPIISQLAGRPFTLLDMAESFGPIFGGQLGPTTRQFIKAASDLSNLVNFVQQVSASGNISLGSYRLDQSQEAGNTTSTFDLRSKPISTIDLDKIRDSVTNIKPIEYSLDSKIGGPAKDFLAQARRVPSSNGSGNGFSFPILKNPMGILQILTGQSNATLFEYDMPQLLVDAPFQIPLPILPPFLVGFFGGNIGAQMDFNFGFDTTGFKNGRPLDGFYVQDTVGGVAGAPDLMEASLFGSVEIGAKVGISLGPVELVAERPVACMLRLG